MIHCRNILITGGAGFIGSHLIRLLVNKYPKVNFHNLDLLTYAGDVKRLADLDDSHNYYFIQGDIRNSEFVDLIFAQHHIDGVFHLAAESHVDNSIINPTIFVETNVMGTLNLLESARKQWLNEKGRVKREYKYSRFLHVSTDEVYGSLNDNVTLFTETTPYAPNSPYSASKASSDFLVRSYGQTYKLPVVITNCSNNFGPDQHVEKLIPKTITRALAGETIPIYGKGLNIRDWIYVKDHCEGLLQVFETGILNETYNIGSRNEKTNIEIVHQICKILDELRPREAGKYSELITFVEDRKGHDFRYAIDNTKITQLGWRSKDVFDNQLRITIITYLQ